VRLVLVLVAVLALPLAFAWSSAHVARSADVRCTPGSGPQLAGADLRSSASELPDELQCADLIGARLDGVDLTQKNLTGAVLRNASLRGADLTQAMLDGADLEGADLSGANLGQADLTGANLSSANLSHADLSQATFTNARLDGADISGAQVVETQGDPASTAGVRGQFPLNEVAAVAAVLLAAALAAGWLPGSPPSAGPIRRMEQDGVTGRMAFVSLWQPARLVGGLMCGCALFVLASIALTFGTYVVSGFSDLLVPSCTGVACVGGITRGPVGLVAVLLLGVPGLALCVYGSRIGTDFPLNFADAWNRASTGIGSGIAVIGAGTTVAAVLVAAATGSGPIVLGLLLAGVVLAALYSARVVVGGPFSARDLKR
jgi:uncharacterized protein YjbI with pentapeptide repeats